MLEIQIYYDKKEELNYYLKKLCFLDELSTNNTNIDFKREMVSDNYSLTDFILILKSNSFMMMYNMVESTVKEIIYAIYDQINISKVTYKKINSDLKKLWETYQFRHLIKNRQAKQDTYENQVHETIKIAISRRSISLDHDNLKLSGNADFDVISEIFYEMGINIKQEKIAKYSGDLADIKTHRNDLAHGGTSFIESARDTSINDLLSMASNVENCLEQIIKIANDYVENEEFKEK